MIGWKNNSTSSYSYNQGHHYMYFASGGNFQIYEDGGLANDPADTWSTGTTYRVKIVLNSGGGAAYYYSINGGRTWTITDCP